MTTTKTPDPKTPDPKTPAPELDESGQAPPAGGSVGPPPSQSPFVSAEDEAKASKDDKAHKDDEKAPAHKENDRDKSHR